MTEYKNNPDNLLEEEIDEVVTRVKILLINSKNEILLGYSHKTYQFLGGHQEEGETREECIKREVLEEAGILLKETVYTPYLVIKHYTKNYKASIKNRLSLIYYYIVKIDEQYHLEKTNYTKDEKEGNFTLLYVPLEKIEELLIKSIPDNKINEVIVEEMLIAISEYKKL